MKPKVNISVNNGISLGMAIAVAISWSNYNSILWAIIHGLLNWLYVIYFAINWYLYINFMSYYVYVIELDKKVGKIKKFRNKNPEYLYGNRCFYVGQSARAPLLRFKQHKEGYKSNSFAKKFGLKLIPNFYQKYNPIPTRKDAEELEKYITLKLRDRRYGVWSN